MTERGRLAVHLTQADRVALHQFAGRLGRGAFSVLDTPDGTQLEVGPLVGLFALPSFTLRVQPKAELHPWNVLYMLHRSSRRTLPLPPVGQELEETDLLEALAALFLSQLRPQLLRGLLRRSEQVQDDLPTLRGRLRVPEYLRRADPTRLPVEYADLQAGHPVNRLFLLVLERLAFWVEAKRSRQQVAELRVLLRDAGVQALGSVPFPAQRHGFTLNRLQRRYEPALNLAWLLLDGMSPVSQAGSWRGQAFAFDMDRLFEKFLERVLIEDILPETRYSGHAQGRGLSQQYLFTKEAQELRPDLIIKEGEAVNLIIDFKNKPPEQSFGRDDVYQMYAYARHLHCAKVLLLYSSQTTPVTIEATQGAPLSLTAAGVDLRQDLRVTLPEFHEQLRTLLRGQGLQL
ncbi:McrC family protein [Deinococcus antarcticus]|uniref:McrC family protein n=1 Tax=Deinococcus antarcticus TaxID=1298767 RepID=A0ABV8A693_9DEIO